MIPVSLKIKGIYSYQKEQNIDFTHLTASKIFGIFGKVGSGKSSILEAMMFALYGEIERMNKRDNRAYNMLNLKSKDFIIDLVIKNNEDIEYRFTVKGKRNSKKFEEVNIKRFVYRKENNEWIPIESENSEKIIGLNYDNFKRTIIIPQGKFQDFLQLTDGERTKMMKELFNLHRYDLSSKVLKIEKENENKLSHVHGQLLQLEDVTEDKINRITEELKKANTELSAAKKEQKKWQKQNEEWNRISELFAIKTKLENEYKQLKDKEQYYQQIKNELNEYNYCVHHFKFPIKNKIQRDERIKKLSTDLKDQKENLFELKKQITFYENKITELKTQYTAREDLKKQANDLTKILEINKIKLSINNLNKRIENGNNIVAQNNRQLKELVLQKSKYKKNIEEIKEKLPDLSILSKIKDWFTVNKNLQKQIAEYRADIQKQKKNIDNTEQEIIASLDTYADKEIATDKNAVNLLIDKEIENIEKQLLQYEQKLGKLKIKQALIDYSNNLQEGEACPVCGSTKHPNKIEADNLNQEINKFKKLIEQEKKQQKKLLQIQNKSNNLYIQIENFTENIRNVRSKISDLEKELFRHRNKYPTKEKLNEKELAVAFEKAESMQAELKKFEKNLQITEKTYEKIFADKESYEKILTDFKNKSIKQLSQKELLQEQIRDVDYNEWNNKTEKIIKKEINTLTEKYTKLTKDYESAEQKFNHLSKETGKFEGKIQTLEKDLSENKTALKEINIEIEQLLKKSNYNNIIDVKLILNKNLNIEKINKKINDYNQHFFNISEQLKKIEQQTENKEYDANKHQELIEKLKKQQEKIEAVGKHSGALENDKEQLTLRLVDKQKMKKELETLQLRAQNIATLKSLFAAKAFVNYVSSIYLQNLVNAANSRFMRLSGQKLKLELNENNNFVIRDFLNGGKLRSVKTLSGGQTFQAALSLALALADNVQSMNGSKSNFFFLDEGFGMLDKDALSVVFDTLKSLGKENRIVGIISHVEDLQQEIDTYLKIENNTQYGSIITNSWEN